VRAARSIFYGYINDNYTDCLAQLTRGSGHWPVNTGWLAAPAESFQPYCKETLMDQKQEAVYELDVADVESVAGGPIVVNGDTAP
jgi:hypothetical protein